MFWSGNEDSSTWVNKRRNTILGRWRQIKLKMWDHHLDLCQRQADFVLDLATANLHGDFDSSPIYSITANTAELPCPF